MSPIIFLKQLKKSSAQAIDSLLSPGAISKITRYTGGIARLINLLCERALFIATLNQQPDVSTATIDEAAGELMLVERENANSGGYTGSLPDLDLLDETQLDGPWHSSASERIFDVSRLDHEIQGSLDDEFMHTEPEADLDQTVSESGFIDISELPATAVSFSPSSTYSRQQLDHLGISVLQREGSSKETNGYALIEAKAGTEYPGNSIAITPQDYPRNKNKPPLFFQSQSFQWASLVGIAVLAGLTGGFGSVYMYLHGAKPTTPAPQVAGSEPLRLAANAPVPAGSPAPSNALRNEPEMRSMPGQLSTSSITAASPRETEAIKAVAASSLFRIEHSELPPLFVLAPLPLFELIAPKNSAASLRPDYPVAESLSASPALEPRAGPVPGTTSGATLSKHEPEFPAIYEPGAVAIDPAAENASDVAMKSPPKEPNIDMAQAASYMSSGDAYLERGDIASARLFYLEAEHSGLPAAMIAVGKTYDPNMLKKLGIKGFAADPDKAAEWYRKAEQAGQAEANQYLTELSRSLASSSPAGEN